MVRDTASRNAVWCGANAYLANFDTLTEIYGRAVKNPALVSHWDELTGEMVEGF